MELFQNHVAHGHSQCRIGPLLRRQPDVAKLGHFAKVRRHRHSFRTFVAHFGVEVGIRRTCHRHVRAPYHQVVGVVPVGGFSHVSLLTPNLRRSRWQVTVPVVERQAGTAQQRQIARTSRIAHHRHGWNGREAHHTVRTIVFDGVGVGRRNHLIDFIPFGADKTTQTTL